MAQDIHSRILESELSSPATTYKKRTAPLSTSPRRRTLQTLSTSAANARQQTLTQIQWVPRRAEADPVDLEMIDQPQQHPRKRSLKKNKTKKNNTLTQMDYIARFAPDQGDGIDMGYIDEATECVGKKRKARPPGAGDDEQGREKQTAKRRKRSPVTADGTASTCNASRGSKSKLGPIARENEREAAPIARRTRSTTLVTDPSASAPAQASHSAVRTPSRSKVTEIPSSQSPESLPPSIRRQFPTSIPLTSPLRERSANIVTPREALTTKVPLKTAGLSPSRPVPSRKSRIVVLPVAISSQGAFGRGALHYTQKRSLMAFSPPKLAPRTTIADSEDESQSESSTVEALLRENKTSAIWGKLRANSTDFVELDSRDAYQAGHETQAALLNLTGSEENDQMMELGFNTAGRPEMLPLECNEDEDGMFASLSQQVMKPNNGSTEIGRHDSVAHHDDDLAAEAQLQSTMLQSRQSPNFRSSAKSPTKHEPPPQAHTPSVLLSQISTQGTPQRTSSPLYLQSSRSKVLTFPMPPEMPSSSPTKSSSPARLILSTPSDAWKRALELDEDAPLLPPRTRITESMMESLPGPPPWSQESFDELEEVVPS